VTVAQNVTVKGARFSLAPRLVQSSQSQNHQPDDQNGPSLSSALNHLQNKKKTTARARVENDTEDVHLSPSMSSVGTRTKHPRQLLLMSDEQLRDLGRKLRVTDQCNLHLIGVSDHGDGPAIVTVTEVNEKFFRVRLDSKDGEHQILQFPGDDGGVASASIINNMPGVPRFNYSSFGPLLTRPDWLIYFDGSSQLNATGRAPSSAAIVIKHLATEKVWTLARFSPSSTNNVCEWSAAVAALRMSNSLPGHSAIVGDSMLVVRGIDGSQKVNAAHLKTYYNEACALKETVVGRVTLHQMDGHRSAHKQLADTPAKLAVSLQRDIRCAQPHTDPEKHLLMPFEVYNVDAPVIQVPGFSMTLPSPSVLFPEIAEIVTKAKVTRATTTAQMRAADEAAFAQVETLQVASLQEFIRIRSFPARPEPPREVREQWAAMVHTAVQRVTSESDPDKRNQAMLDLMVMPNKWLPAAVPTRRVVAHFQKGVPFSMDVRGDRASASEKAKEKRLAEMVMRKTKNRDIRGAVRVLRSESETADEERTDEQKLQDLQAKFPAALKQPLGNLFKDETLPTFPTAVLHSVLKKMKRTSAPCIDGWQKGHLRFAMAFHPDVADDFCCLAVQILREQFSQTVMDCLRAARLVGIAKPDGGIRPVAVSNFFCKVVGLMCIRMSGATCADWQYAVGKLNGTKEVVHRLRKHKHEGKVVCKFDVKNAYNELPRRLGEEALKTQSPYLKAYFRMVYYHPGAMVVYRRDGHSIITAAEGVRQGDALSTLVFCKAIDLIIPEILQACSAAGASVEEILLYADDLNVVVNDARSAAIAAKCVKEVFAKYGLEVNLAANKSAALIPPSDPYWSDPAIQEMFSALQYAGLPHDAEFVALGSDLGTYVDINGSRSFFEKQLKKQTDFFSLLDRVHRIGLHPAVLFTILRLCGNPRLEYLCSVTPPSIGLQHICDHFDHCVRVVLNGPSLLRGRLAANNPLVYAVEGAGMTNYKAIHKTLYDESLRQSFSSGRQRAAPTATLAFTNSAASTDAAASAERKGYDSSWMFHTSSSIELTPSEFVTNLCMRLMILPEPLPPAVHCDCHHTTTDPVSFMDHVLKCDRATNFGFKARHDVVINDALVPVAKAFGINTTVEPTCYTYSDGSRKRPDIIFHTSPKVTTDLTIVFPSSSGVGVAASIAAAEKQQKHGDAVRAVGHDFIPFAMEITGVLDNSAHALIKALATSLNPTMRHAFYTEMYHAVQVAVARGRANALNSAIAKQKNADGNVRML
jgi:ribonuclease HI